MKLFNPLLIIAVIALLACSSGLTEDELQRAVDTRLAEREVHGAVASPGPAPTATPHPPLGATYYPSYAELLSVARGVWGNQRETPVIRWAEDDDIMLNLYAAGYLARACLEGEEPSPEGFRQFARRNLSGDGPLQDALDAYDELSTRITSDIDLDVELGCLAPFTEPTINDIGVIAYLD